MRISWTRIGKGLSRKDTETDLSRIDFQIERTNHEQITSNQAVIGPITTLRLFWVSLVRVLVGTVHAKYGERTGLEPNHAVVTFATSPMINVLDMDIR